MGKRQNEKEKAVIISGAISGILFLLSVLVSLVFGIAINWWNLGWVIVVATVIVSAKLSVVTKMIVELKKAETEAKNKTEENK